MNGLPGEVGDGKGGIFIRKEMARKASNPATFSEDNVVAKTCCFLNVCFILVQPPSPFAYNRSQR